LHASSLRHRLVALLARFRCWRSSPTRWRASLADPLQSLGQRLQYLAGMVALTVVNNRVGPSSRCRP
jgi:hypothetical protein